MLCPGMLVHMQLDRVLATAAHLDVECTFHSTSKQINGHKIHQHSARTGCRQNLLEFPWK